MKIKREVLENIFQHAIEDYPYECCGIVTGRGVDQRVHRCRNIQNELHAEDPERYPRDAHTAYAIDRKEAEKIYDEAKDRGEGIIAFYHSHIDCDAYFSKTDIAVQTVFGEPEFPDVIHIVISVMAGKIHEMKCYKWDRNNKDFIRVEECD